MAGTDHAHALLPRVRELGEQLGGVPHVGQLVRVSNKQMNRDLDVREVLGRGRILAVVLLVLLLAAEIKLFELSSHNELLPVGHVLHGRAGGEVAEHHIDALVVVQRDVVVHQLSQHIHTHVSELGAEDRAELLLHKIGLEEGVNLRGFEKLEQIRVRNNCLERTSEVLDEGHWPQRHKFVDVLEHCGVSVRKGHEHDHGALGVADVGDVGLAGEVVNLLERSREVEFGHLLHGEVPELLLLGVQGGVVAGVFVSPRISNPHILATLGQSENGGQGLFVANTAVRTIK